MSDARPLHRQPLADRLKVLQPCVGRLVQLVHAPNRDHDHRTHTGELVAITTAGAVLRAPSNRLANPRARYSVGPVDTLFSLAQLVSVDPITDPDHLADLEAQAIGAPDVIHLTVVEGGPA